MVNCYSLLEVLRCPRIEMVFYRGKMPLPRFILGSRDKNMVKRKSSPLKNIKVEQNKKGIFTMSEFRKRVAEGLSHRAGIAGGSANDYSYMTVREIASEALRQAGQFREDI